jgi:preprotein translocase subunit SecF
MSRQRNRQHNRQHNGLATRLYRGQVSYDFVSPARRRRWYAVSGLLILVCVVSMVARGFNFGIEFKGGSTYELPRHGKALHVAEQAMHELGVKNPVVQTLGSGRIRVTTPEQTTEQVTRSVDLLAQRFEVAKSEISPSSVGATWGSEISKKALQGLILFLIAVVIYISLRFEPKMALAAFLALLHDLVVTAGIYSLVGFEVTPSTVIAVLTILGFSLYDTVVVFDKVRDNTVGLQSGGRISYSQAANLAVNQTLMRSINTSIIALLPVASLLFVGAGLLGAGTLKDLALAQLVGLASGAYSSIFIATPLLVQFKEREPAMQALSERVARAAAAGKNVGTPAAAAVAVGAVPGTVSVGDQLARPATGGQIGAFSGHRVDRPRDRTPGGGARPGGARRSKRRR